MAPLHGLLARWTALPPGPLSEGLVWANLMLLGVAGARWGRGLGGGAVGGLVCGTLLQTASVTAAFVHIGAGELLHMWWIPLGLSLALEPRGPLPLAAVLVGAALTSFYAGFMLALGVGLLALLGRWHLGVPLALAGGALAAILALVSPPLPIAEVTDGVFDPVRARLDPASLVWPGPRASSWHEQAYGGGQFIGALALVLAGLGVARAPRQAREPAALAGLAILLALGSGLSIAGRDPGLPLPMAPLNALLARLVAPVHFPVRLMALACVALAGLAVVGLARAPQRRRTLVLALAALSVAEVGLRQRADWPWQRQGVTGFAELEPLQSADGAALDLLTAVLRRPRDRRAALLSQMRHGRPTQAVALERLEAIWPQGQAAVRSTRLVAHLAALARGASPPEADYRASLSLLRGTGFRWAVATAPLSGLPDGWAARLRKVCGAPHISGGDATVWALPAVAATPDERATWAAEHAARLAR